MIKFIADVGANGNQSMERIDALICAAKDAGCAAVKFQYYRADRLYAPGFSDITAVKAGELPTRFLPLIASLCRRAGLEFHCTPFDVGGVFDLRPWVDAFKIASYSILDLKLIDAASGQGLPLGISTGGATAAEIGAAYDVARKNLKPEDITLYHCAPEYPAPLRAGMMTSIRAFWKNVGYSDHTRRTEAIFAAIAAGAQTIEFHIDLDDGAGSESVHGHCWTASEAKQMITSAMAIDMMLNAKEEPVDYTEVRKARNDPGDEMRPLKEYRDELSKYEDYGL